MATLVTTMTNLCPRQKATLSSKMYQNYCFSNSLRLISSSALLIVALTFTFISSADSLLCYSCVSTQPGCTLDSVNWLIHSAESCPSANDKCVKIIESRGADTRVVRGCLSKLMPYRNDVPADHYEGCRAATKPGNRAVYIQNHITELQLERPKYDNITYCFCEFDHWCNSAPSATHSSSSILLLSLLSTAIVASLLTAAQNF